MVFLILGLTFSPNLVLALSIGDPFKFGSLAKP